MSEADITFEQEGKKPGSPVQADGVHWYAPGPVSKAFLLDDSFLTGLMGPFGSGKSVTCTMKLNRNLRRQIAHTKASGFKGMAFRRTAIIRNTYPELRTTTMNTFFQWVPKHTGHWRDAGPPMLRITDKKNNFEWEILFVALDRPDDVKKLLSMELSDAWVNEARETPKAVIDGLTGRVGRYPAVWQGGCANPQIIMDTNPPDTDHWWYVLSEQDISDEKKRQIIMSMREAEERLRSAGVLGRDQPLFRFYRQPSGMSPEAENKRNLRAGYYEVLMAGKDQDWINVYVHGNYGFVMDGLPVYPEYNDALHGSKDFPVLRGLGFRIGLDFGLTPAAVVNQRAGNGRWLTHYELVSERMGIVSFAHELGRYLGEVLPGAKFTSVRGDPAGDAVTPEEQTCFAIMRANGFPIAEAAPTNDPVRRREAVANLLKINIDGLPGMSINPRCTTFRKGMSGGYHRRRLQVAGENRYREVPEKNKYSHVCEADQYDKVSAGEDRNVTVSAEHRNGARPTIAESEYNVLGE